MTSEIGQGDVKLTYLTTGTVRIRPSMRSQPVSKLGILRRLKSLRDREWTSPLPVGVFIIHHPEGLFLFDTGQSPCCNESGYFPRLALFNSFLSEFTIDKMQMFNFAKKFYTRSIQHKIVLDDTENDKKMTLEFELGKM